ncbi:putative holin-like toxin [Virgibacillus dakarensis]|uniref:putative holin-like toxin n=1 Tax=Virgibacillus dakarensis TaxID=1917889 RepID=UPI0013566A1F|nr:putative holin-like toxin [Virgibacillus dakarensis]
MAHLCNPSLAIGLFNVRTEGGDAMDESTYQALSLMILFGTLVAMIMSNKK